MMPTVKSSTSINTEAPRREVPSWLAFSLLAVFVALAALCLRCAPTTLSESVQAPEIRPTSTGTSQPAEPQGPPTSRMQIPYTRYAYVLENMDACVPAGKIAMGRRLILAQQIDRIGREHLGNSLVLDFFPTLVCIESAYGTAKYTSSAGAAGLTQVMPQYAKEFGEACGLPGITGEDLKDSEVNLTIGACRFAALVKYFKGNVALALAAYNAGRDSPAIRRLSSGGHAGIEETNGYLAKAFVQMFRNVNGR